MRRRPDITRHIKTTAFVAAIAGITLPMLGTLSGCQSRPKIDTSAAVDAERRLVQAVQLNGQAAQLAAEGKDDEAILKYQESLGLRDDIAATWNDLGVLLMQRKVFVDAVEAFKRAGDLAPSDPRPPTNAGLAYHRAGFDADAMRYYREAMRRDDRWLDALRGAAVSQMRLRRASLEAKQLVERGLLIDPDAEWRDLFERELYRIERELAEIARLEARDAAR